MIPLIISTLFLVSTTQQLLNPDLRQDNDGLVVPVSTRFMMRPQRATINVYQVMKHVEDVVDTTEETWHEGPLDLNGKIATRLSWKAFESDINQRIEEEMMWVPLKVLSGNGQVVSGVLYDLQVLAGTSNCSRYEINAYTIQQNHCVHFNGPKRAIFSILVQEKSSTWNPFVPDWDRYFSVMVREVQAHEEF